jgi:hypothetical protein
MLVLKTFDEGKNAGACPLGEYQVLAGISSDKHASDRKSCGSLKHPSMQKAHRERRGA